MDYALLKELTEIPGISGREDRVISFVCNYLKGKAADIHVDKIGNITAAFPGSGKGSLAFFAHMDELGLIVRRVENDGFLRVERIGGVPEKSLLMTPVEVHSRDGAHTYPGIVGTTAHHVTPPEKKFSVTTTAEMYIDMGLHSREEVEALGVGVGSFVTYKPNYTDLGNRITSKSLDDRACVYAMLRLADALTTLKHDADIYMIFSVQEEFSIRACLPAFTRLMPDAAICLDIAVACDTPELQNKYDVRLDNGPTVMYMDFHGRGTLGGCITNPKLNLFLENLATENNIPFQRELIIGEITDDAFTQYVGDEGVPMGHVSIPTRYTHSPYEMISKRDLEDLIRFMTEISTHFSSAIDISRG